MGPHGTTPAAGPTAKAKDVNAVLDGIRRIVRVLRESATDVERRLGISGAQLYVLQVLRDGPSESLNDLAARTHTHQSSVSVVVARLVDRGLVSRERSDVDARRIRLALTPEGEELVRNAPEPVQRRLIEALHKLPAAEVSELARGLSDLTRAMGVSDQPAEMLFDTELSERTGAT
jgi:MarR family transcriptional regulator, lower aerobic nicotinate degradation pathway regulator